MVSKQPKRNPRPGVDAYGRTSLHQAAAAGDASRCAELLASGADQNAQDDNGWTALHFAAQSSSAPICEMLLRDGARTDLQDSFGNTALHKAVFHSRGNGVLIGLLRQAGADPLVENHHGVSPLSLAGSIANYDVRQFFADLP